MPAPERQAHRLTLSLLLWGAAGSGRSSVVRSLYGAADPRCRGDFVRLTSADLPGAFLHASFDLPDVEGAPLRLEVYAAPSEPAAAPVRRLLAEQADTILFVADTAGAMEETVAAWCDLHHTLAEREQSGAVAVTVFANETDRLAGVNAEDLRARLRRGCPGRRVRALLEGCAPTGRGTLRAVRESLVAALERVDLGRPTGARAPVDGLGARRRQLVAAFDARFGSGDDGAVIDHVAEPRPALPEEGLTPDASAADIVAANRWMSVHEADLRSATRERALGQVLIDLAHLCARAVSPDTVLRSALGHLAMNLEAAGGWFGLPGEDGAFRVEGSGGRVDLPAPLLDAASALADTPLGQVVPVASPELETHGCGPGLFVRFPLTGGEWGWLWITAAPGGRLADEAAAVLGPATAIVAPTLGRLATLLELGELTRVLESRVDQRTQQLREERDRLEERVRERTRELEETRREALEAERALSDRRRRENVHQLAAGLAHELNNPLGAIRSNLDFLRETLEDAEPGTTDAQTIDDLRSAVRDSMADADRMSGRIQSLLGEAATQRRAAVRTRLSDAVAEGIAHFRLSHPGTPRPSVEGVEGLTVGIPPGELAQWIFRVLSALGSDGAVVRLRAAQDADGVALVARADARPCARSADTLRPVCAEAQEAGASVELRDEGRATSCLLRLPSGVGEPGRASLTGGVR
jgi:hypothetical protein